MTSTYSADGTITNSKGEKVPGLALALTIMQETHQHPMVQQEI